MARDIPYDVSSFQALLDWTTQQSGCLVSPRQVAPITTDPRFVGRLYRQQVTLTGSDTLLVQTALRASSPLLYKVYRDAIEQSDRGTVVRRVNKREEWHHVRSANLWRYSWLTAISLAPY